MSPAAAAVSLVPSRLPEPVRAGASRWESVCSVKCKCADKGVGWRPRLWRVHPPARSTTFPDLHANSDLWGHEILQAGVWTSPSMLCITPDNETHLWCHSPSICVDASSLKVNDPKRRRGRGGGVQQIGRGPIMAWDFSVFKCCHLCPASSVEQKRLMDNGYIWRSLNNQRFWVVRSERLDFLYPTYSLFPSLVPALYHSLRSRVNILIK